jgi:hypothetical protein
MAVKRKLIEVALLLEAINKAALQETSIRHGIQMSWSVL